MKSKSKVENESRIQIDQLKCVQCGICLEVCPFGLPTKIANHYYIKNINECTECSACKKNCPMDAIIMNEMKGCGCLWDVKSRKKAKTNCCANNQKNNSSCC